MEFFTVENITELSDADLQDQYRVITDEVNKRSARWNYGAGLDMLILQLQEAEGTAHQPNEEWVQPVFLEETYQQGALVTFEGRQYESLVHANGVPPTDAAAWAPVQTHTEGDAVEIEINH